MEINKLHTRRCLNLTNMVMLSEEARPKQRIQHDANSIRFCNSPEQAVLYGDPCTAGETVKKGKKMVAGRDWGWRGVPGALAVQAVLSFLAMMLDE